MSQFTNWVSNITFTAEEARAFGDVMMEAAYNDPAVQAYHTVVSGIKAKKKIPFVGRLSKITKADAGCGTGATSQSIPTSEKEWDPIKAKAWLEECADDLEETFMVWLLAEGNGRTDFTASDITRFLLQRFSEAQAEDALRQAWLSDTAYVAGDLTGGAGDLPNYNLYDGLWKQLVAIGTATPARRVTISENAESAVAGQLNLGATFAYDLFKEMYESADPRLRADPSAYYLVSDEIFYNYMTYLESKGVSESFMRIENGATALRFRSHWIYNMNVWSRYIQSDFLISGAYDTPNRAVFTTRPNLLVGFDSPSAVGTPEIWYERKDEKVNLRCKYKVDAKVGHNYMVQLAY